MYGVIDPSTTLLVCGNFVAYIGEIILQALGLLDLLGDGVCQSLDFLMFYPLIGCRLQ